MKDRIFAIWVVNLLANPSIYLKRLLINTMIMGLVLVSIHFSIEYFGLHKPSVTGNIHSIIGLVLGLLLVFRTNTAYDRWWEARKIIASMEANMTYLTISFCRCLSHEQMQKSQSVYDIHELNREVFNYLSGNSKSITSVKNLFSSLKKNILERGGSDVGNMDRKLTELIDQFSHLKRIKHTPIPLSYTFHIKVSIFIYLLSLPFGLLYGMGIMSIFLVMLLYFVIAGIEIISNEIEDPFHGDPNDLPLDDLMSEITLMCSLPDLKTAIDD